MLAVLGSLYSFAGRQHILPYGLNPARAIEKYPEKKPREIPEYPGADPPGRSYPRGRDDWPPLLHKAKHAPKEKNRRIIIGPHAAAAIRLLILTGARLREILHLKWEYVVFERGMLLLPDSKTGKKAIVLNAPALDVLTNLPRIGAYVIAGENATTCVIRTLASVRGLVSVYRLLESCWATPTRLPPRGTHTSTLTRCAGRLSVSVCNFQRLWANNRIRARKLENLATHPSRT
jgi:integrase